MTNMMADRRSDPRYPLILRAEVTERSSGKKLSGRTSDISRTGCYVDTREPLSSGSSIQVKLTHLNEGIEVTGTVRYVSPGLGMGVQFDENIPDKQMAILRSWLEAAARQPA